MKGFIEIYSNPIIFFSWLSRILRGLRQRWILCL